MKHTVFYAWQSDLRQDCNRYLIRDALQKALTRLEQDDSIEDCPRLDHDTKGVPGTPAIADTIFEKIANARLFVADVSFVGSSETKRLPNPNVMIELGYALHALSSDRVILVMNEVLGGAEDLPFDLRHRRHPICYRLDGSTPEGGGKKKKDACADLAARLSEAIREVLKIPEKKTPTRNLKLRINPTRSGRRQHAQIRLFNSGAGPIFVESWWVTWQTDGRRRARSSVSTIKGTLPVRIDEQDAAELLVEVGDDLENITGIGVFDGDQYLWLASDQELAVFKHRAISHRLPEMKSHEPERVPLETCKIEIEARTTSSSVAQREQLEIVFRNKSDISIPVANVRLSWTYSPPRSMPKQTGKVTVAETGGSVSLTPKSNVNPIPPGAEATFVLTDNMASALVDLLHGDVQDDDILVEIVTSNGNGWKACQDNIPEAVKIAAQSVLASMQQ